MLFESAPVADPKQDRSERGDGQTDWARERGGEATPRSRYDASLLVSSSTSAFQPVFPNTGGYPLSRDSSLGEANMSRESSLDRTR